MKLRTLCLAGLGAVGLGLFGCSGDDGGGNPDGGGQLTQWEGDAPHLHIEGTIRRMADGTPQPLNVDLTGADAQDLLKLHCEREYFGTSDGAGGWVDNSEVGSEVKIKYDFTDPDGNIQHARFELKRHDFRDDAIGTVVPAVLRDDSASAPAGKFWLEWQNNDPTDKAYEYGAQSGSFKLEKFDCTPDPDEPGICNHTAGDKIGGFIQGVWSPSEKLAVSFTAVCDEDSVEPFPE